MKRILLDQQIRIRLCVRIRDYQLAIQANKVILEMPRSVVLVGWKPPAEGWVKFHTNGACSSNGVAGCGGIIRGCDGE